jgi:deoxyribodipyrimidine photo-lyase
MKTALILFNRDLRVDDNPALAAAARAERTLPLFVFDERLLGSRFAAPNRVAFMREALADLDESLRRAGARLFLRRGDPVAEALALARECGAEELHVSADYSAYARARERRLAAACEEERIGFHAHPGTTIVQSPRAVAITSRSSRPITALGASCRSAAAAGGPASSPFPPDSAPGACPHSRS